ncbi:MAG: ABC transporter ATP-binding protein [Acidimicrobiia bacterium]|nr:ABC transporter ATP-binding protein [Acidimicrobiia bacterium]
MDYGSGEVVQGVDLRVEPGEILAILGPNGAGKTSTLAAIAGLAPASRGRVRLAGRDLSALSPDRRNRNGIVLVPEDRGLFPRLSVYDHLWLGGHGRPDRSARERVYELFPALVPRRRQVAGALSGGEAQMLSIATALLSRPQVLLIDELSFGLAPTIVRRLLERCRQLADEEGLGLVVVEQFVDLVLETADRAAVMSRGRFVLEGPAAELAADRERLHQAYLGTVAP